VLDCLGSSEQASIKGGDALYELCGMRLAAFRARLPLEASNLDRKWVSARRKAKARPASRQASRAPGEPWGYHMAFDPLAGKAKQMEGAAH
jgi:hypothetical protein